MKFAIAVCGRGQAGKSTTSRLIAEISGLKYSQSTSQALAEMIFEKSKSGCFGRSFEHTQDCWEHRSEHRALWGQLIAEYNKPHGTTLYEDMLPTNDILDGIRRIDELRACQKRDIIDFAIWIDRDIAPPDVSLDYGSDACDIIINNNGSLDDLREAVNTICLGLITIAEVVGE
jgi:hypothetical protein